MCGWALVRRNMDVRKRRACEMIDKMRTRDWRFESAVLKANERYLVKVKQFVCFSLAHTLCCGRLAWASGWLREQAAPPLLDLSVGRSDRLPK
jgi:hypothetical protein